MARRRDDLLSFNPAVPVVARRAFTGAGRHFRPGDAVDWKRMSIDQRRVRQLFDSGKLMHKDVSTLDAPSVETAPADDRPAVSSLSAAADEAGASFSDDGLEDLKMPALREIAEAEGAPTKLSKADQVKAIRDNRG